MKIILITLCVGLLLLFIFIASKYIFISKLDNDYPVIGAGRTLRNIYNQEYKCPQNPTVQYRYCPKVMCFNDICIVGQ